MSLVLLDTHAFVWAVSTPDRLGRQARALIRDANNTLGVSAATAWELSTKVRLGKFPQATALVANFEHIVSRLGAIEVPMTSGDALFAGQMEWSHRDPFDRMLAAQAIRSSAVLITKDTAFRNISSLAISW